MAATKEGKDRRYSSGTSTSLTRTDKEKSIDALEGELWAEFSDEFYVSLKKLTCSELRQLTLLVARRIFLGDKDELPKGGA